MAPPPEAAPPTVIEILRPSDGQVEDFDSGAASSNVEEEAGVTPERRDAQEVPEGDETAPVEDTQAAPPAGTAIEEEAEPGGLDETEPPMPVETPTEISIGPERGADAAETEVGETVGPAAGDVATTPLAPSNTVQISDQSAAIVPEGASVAAVPVATATAIPTEPRAPTQPVVSSGPAAQVAQGPVISVGPAPAQGIGVRPIAESAAVTVPVREPTQAAAQAGEAVGIMADNADTGRSMDPLLRDLIERIRQRLGDTCLVAVAGGGNGTPIQIAVMGDDDQTIADFQDSILNDFEITVGRSSHLVASDQCAALDVLRNHPEYPIFPLAFSLPTGNAIESGGNLRGIVLNSGSRPVNLLIVDDNGVVQNLDRFVTDVDGEPRFDIPMSRPGPPRATRQLLIAITTPTPLSVLQQEDPQNASDVFPSVVSQAPEFGIGVAIFDVR